MLYNSLIDFFHSAGHPVRAFLPDFYLNFERIGELRRQAHLGLGDIRASKLPDDIQLLQQLLAQVSVCIPNYNNKKTRVQ